jgi:hypothetical protein
MSLRVLALLITLLLAAAASGCATAGRPVTGRSVHGYSGYSQGGALYINAFPYLAQVSLDGKPLGVANDLQAALVDARPGVHRLTVTAPGYEPATVAVWVALDWTTRVRLMLVPVR